MNRWISILVVLVLAGCGGAFGRGAETPRSVTMLQQLRKAAAARPRDPAVWALLGEIELLGEAGDASRARAALDHAISLAPNDSARARLHLLSAWEHELYGRMTERLDAYLAAVEAARTGRTNEEGAKWNPVIAEVALDGVRRSEGSVPGFEARVRPGLERVLSEPGGLGHAAVDAAAIAVANAGQRRGDDQADEALARRLGCIRDWRAAGPFGPYANLSFDERLPAEAPGPLAGPYDLRPGVTDQAPFDGEVTACQIRLRNEEHAAGGSTIAEAFVDVETAGPKLLRIDTGSSLKLYVDGELTFTVDRRTELSPSYVFIPLELSAGRHELEVKLMTSASNPGMVVTLDWPGRLGPGYDPSRGVELPEPETPAELVFVARALQGRGDSVGATWHVGLSDGGELASAAMVVQRADIIAGEPFLPDEARDELQGLLYQRALARAPDTLYAAIYEVSRSDDDNEIFDGYVALTERFPEVVELRYIVAELQEQRGRPREAEAALREIQQDFPNECRPVERLRALLTSNGRIAEANGLVENLLACDATSQARFELLRSQRRWDAAAAELTRLEPFLEDRQARGLRLGLATARGDRDAEIAIRDEIMDEHPESSRTTVRRIDRLLAAGRRSPALDLLDEVARRDPTHMEGLRNLRRDLTGQDDLEDYRIDGTAVLDSYLADGDPYPDAPQVLVLDYMVTRIYPDGSSRHLVHQITRVQSEEAKDRLGQYSPRGRLLTLRSIKPDGRRLEPERIAGVDSIPLTDLAVGDYIEEEYILTTGPRLNGGFSSVGWTFASTIQPFHHSEMVAIVPDGVQLTVEATGPVPAPTEERQGGDRVMRWLMQRVPIRESEPDTVPVPVTWPTLRFGWRAGWGPWFVAERDFLMHRAPSHPLGEALCQGIVEGASSREEAATRIVDWVHEHVEPADNSWGWSAPSMLYVERGHLVRAAQYLMRECDIPAEIGLVRGIHRMEPGDLASSGIYSTAIIYVPASGGESELILTPGNRDADVGWIPADIRGQEAIVLAEGTPRVTIPDPGPTTDHVRYEVDVRMTGGGAAMVAVSESHRGGAAANWRRILSGVPEGERVRVLAENYVGRLFPGAEVRGIDPGEPSARNKPFTMRYAVDAPRFGRVTNEAVLVPALFAVDLANSLAQRPNRATTLGVGARSVEIVTTIRGVASPAQTVQRLPRVALRGSGGARYQREATVEGDAVVIRRELVVPEMNVSAEDYRSFAEFCRAVTAAESTEIAVAPGR